MSDNKEFTPSEACANFQSQLDKSIISTSFHTDEVEIKFLDGDPVSINLSEDYLWLKITLLHKYSNERN